MKDLILWGNVRTHEESDSFTESEDDDLLDWLNFFLEEEEETEVVELIRSHSVQSNLTNWVRKTSTTKPKVDEEKKERIEMPIRQTSIRDWMSNPVKLNNKCFVKVIREIKVERLEQQEQLHTPEGSQDEVHHGVRETTVSEVGRFNPPHSIVGEDILKGQTDSKTDRCLDKEMSALLNIREDSVKNVVLKEKVEVEGKE